MIRPKRHCTVTVLVIFWILCTSALAGDWTDSVEVRYQMDRCVSYRARLNGEFLEIQANHEAGWHTYALDNKLRVQEKLAGKRALGVDRPTEIALTGGLELVGPWYQSPPKDFSNPELRLFSWGFEGKALFVAKVRRSGTGPARIAIGGQACSRTTCKDIDIAVPLPLVNTGKAVPSDIDFKGLVQVR